MAESDDNSGTESITSENRKIYRTLLDKFGARTRSVKKGLKYEKVRGDITMDYDETSQEAVTAIAMIKNMSSARKLSGMKTSSLLPRLTTSLESKRASPYKNRDSFSLGSTKASNSTWPSIGVTLASMEFKRGLERKKLRYSEGDVNLHNSKRQSIPRGTDFPQRDSTRLTVLKSIFAKTGDTANNSAGIVPAKRFSTSKKSPSSTKRSHSTSSATNESGYLSLPLLSVVKINPIHRQAFHTGSKLHTSK